MPTTPRWGLPYPSGSDLVSSGDDAIRSLAESLDNHAKHMQGVLASRPEQPVTAGTHYYATDIGTLFLSEGTSWVSVNLTDDAVTTTTIADSAVTAAKIATATLSLLCPPGVVIPFAGSVAPAGWLLCGGPPVSRTTYAALYAVIGTTFGAGDGTTFGLPNVKGRTIVGVGTSGGSTFALGATGGAETHQLTEAELAVHDHGVSDMTDSPYRQIALTSAGAEGHGVPNNPPGLAVVDAWGRISNAGGDVPHNNLAPYIVLNAIIRTGLLA